MTKERVILGEDCIYSADSNITGVNNNRVVVGGAGSGKTFSLLEPELLETLRTRETNRIVICTKRRIVEKYKRMFEEAGYTVYDLNLADPEAADCAYDPVFYLKSEEDIASLAEDVIMSDERKERSNADPFWDESSIALHEAEIALAMMLKKNATYADVLDLHYSLKFEESGSGITTSLDAAFAKVGRAKPDCYALSCWRTFKEAAPRTAKSIYVTMNATLNAFTPAIRESMKTKPKIDFRKFVQEKSILFVTTSPVNKALHSLANMFMAQAISELYEIAENQPSGILPVPTHISFDDFATGARVAEFPEKISIFREKGISCTLLIQSEAQLEKMYGHWGAIEILDNCDSYIFLGGNNVETARSVSIRLDVPLADILYMPVGQEIVFRRGQNPVITKRYDIQKDELYQKVTEEYNRQISCRER